jgi:hypothetical protein
MCIYLYIYKLYLNGHDTLLLILKGLADGVSASAGPLVKDIVLKMVFENYWIILTFM